VTAGGAASVLAFSAVAVAGAVATPLVTFSIRITGSQVLHQRWYNGIVASLHTWRETALTLENLRIIILTEMNVSTLY
jgi:hypothetical protein